MSIKHLGAYLVITFAATISHADLIKYDFNGAAGTPAFIAATILDANVTGANLVRGSGLTAVSATDAINASGWTTASSIDANDYYGFSLAPTAGKQMTITSISFAERRSATGIRNFEIRSSLDSYAAAIAGSAIAVPDNDLVRDQSITVGSIFANLPSSVEFRIYGYSAEGTGGTWRLQNHSTFGGLLVDGTTSSAAAVSEPAAVPAVAGIAALFAIHRLFQRRRSQIG